MIIQGLKKNWLQLVSVAAIVFLIIEMSLLLKQNADLRAQIASFLNPPLMETLNPGDHVESIKVQSLAGSMTEISYSDSNRNYLLFVLSTTCPHCEKTFPLWQMIARNVNQSACSVFGISIHSAEDTKKYVEENLPVFNIMIVSDTSFRRSYKVAGVPETILINGKGIVKQTWVGELTLEKTNEIQKLLGG